MKRKIIQAGPTTRAVTLPMQWVKQFNLKKGEEVEVQEQGSELKISTKKRKEQESATIDTQQTNPISTKLIGLLYKAGYKKIRANYNPSAKLKHRGRDIKELDMIKNTFDHLTGMQIWEIGKDEKGNYATAIETAKASPEEFENILNKLFLHLIHQAELIEEILGGKKELFEEASLSERLINQATDFCIRILVTYGHKEQDKTLYYYDLVTSLESIGDKYFSMALSYKENKQNYSTQTTDYLKKLKEQLETISSIYRKFDSKKITQLTKQLKEQTKKYEEHINKNKTNLISYNTYAIMLGLMELIEKIYFLNHEHFREKEEP